MILLLFTRSTSSISRPSSRRFTIFFIRLIADIIDYLRFRFRLSPLAIISHFSLLFFFIADIFFLFRFITARHFAFFFHA